MSKSYDLIVNLTDEHTNMCKGGKRRTYEIPDNEDRPSIGDELAFAGANARVYKRIHWAGTGHWNILARTSSALAFASLREEDGWV
jgi:hypothetical protein